MKTWAGVSGVMFAVFLWICSAQAQYVSEDFTGSTASDWTFVSAAGDGAVLTGNGTIDPEGDGWLRLTRDKTNQNSFVYYNNAIQTSQGLVFTFDFVIWSATSSNADGFALVIFDAEASPVATGGWGGSLGYAQHTSNSLMGLNGGIAGFGFDTFGNFSNPTEGRIGGPGKRANSIAIRGSMGASRTQGYEYITGVEGLTRFATGSAASRDAAVVHTVRLTITPERLVSIEWKEEGEEWETLLDSYACTLTCPSQVKFGFTASTGSVYSNHEIRNVEVNPYLDDDEPPVLDDGPFVAAGPWPALKRSRSTAFVLGQNYDLLWTFSDDYATCADAPTHKAAYRLDGTTPWRWLKVESDDDALAWTELPVDVMIDGTYQFYTAVQDCAGQTGSRTNYFKVESGNVLPVDSPPEIGCGPWLAAGPWPLLPTSSSRAFILNQDYAVLWTFSDDYSICSALCTQRARYRKVGDTAWTSLNVNTDPDGNWYAYTTLPAGSLENGTYQFRVDVLDCTGQRTYSKYHYFKVE